MANLKSTTVTSGLVSEKIGTTPPDVEYDYTDNMGTGLGGTYTVGFGVSGTEHMWDLSAHQTPRVIEYDPHNANRFVVIYSKGGAAASRYGGARIGIIKSTESNEAEIFYSSEYIFYAGTTHNFCFAFDPSVANKFVVTYKDTPVGNWPSPGNHYAKVGTISPQSSDPTGYQITFGAQTNVGSNYNNKIRCTDIAYDPNVPGRFSIVSTYWWGSIIELGFIICGDIQLAGTANVIDFGTEFAYSNYGWSHHEMRIAYDPNTANRLIVAWIWGYQLNHGFTTGTHLSARALDISGSPTVFTRPQTNDWYTSGAFRYPAIAWDKNNAERFYILCQQDDNGDRPFQIMGQCPASGAFSMAGGDLSGAGWTPAVKHISINFAYYDQYSTSRGRLLISYQDDADSDKGKVRTNLIDWASNATTLGAEATFNATPRTDGTWISSDYKLPGRFIVFWHEYSGPYHYGKVISGRINKNKITVDLSTGSFFTINLQTVDYTIDEFVITGVSTGVTTFDLRVIQGAPARYFDWSWITNVRWPEDNFVRSSPRISATDNAVDVYSFTTYDNGTIWYGSIVGQDMK